MRTRIAPLLLLALLALPSAGRATDDGSDGPAALVDGDALDSEAPAPKPCGEGSKVSCGKVTTQTCTEWKQTTTTGGVNIGTTGGGVTYTVSYTCASWTTVEKTLYKNP